MGRRKDMGRELSEPVKLPRKKTAKSVYSPVVPALEEAGKVLSCLADTSSRLTLTEICRYVGIHSGKAFSILSTLKQLGFVDKEPRTKTYSLGIGLVPLARHVLDNLDYRETIYPFLKDLSRQTSGIACFVLLQGENLFVIAKHQENEGIGLTLRIGHRLHYTDGVPGKIIAAFMPENEREKLLSRKDLYFNGDPSKLDMRTVRDDLAKCRKAGFAVDNGKVYPGISGIAAPVFGAGGRISGAIVLMGAFPESLIEEYGNKTAAIGREVSARLGADVGNVYS
jgi:DNA-binding IclR family transcriptional regulator